MGNCCNNPVVPEHPTVTPSPSDVQKFPNSFVKVEPGIHRCDSNGLGENHQEHIVATENAEILQVQADTSVEVPESETEVYPETSTSSNSPNSVPDLPKRMVKVMSKKNRHVSIIKWRLFRRGTGFPTDVEVPQVQADTSVEVPESETEVYPETSTSSNSPNSVPDLPKRMVKVMSKKNRHDSNGLGENHQEHIVATENAEILQVQADTSVEVPESETEVYPETSTSANSPNSVPDLPKRMVKVMSKKNRHVSIIKWRLFRRGTGFPTDVEVPQVQADTSVEVPESETEVYPETSTSANSPNSVPDLPKRMVKVMSKKNRRVSIIKWRLFRRGTGFPTDVEVPQVQADTSVEVPESETEVTVEMH
ncbi:uncharacterized protein LOC128118103 isoform X2 [Peromyscus californicus insignis]|uniref:uncharacterized protein LOC128118103 isoform X2 n=1 Tax=Peromyscus californicus insignis TaxID=564181 RepID=UPI0022A6D9F7|nr:uncharacterized protein LOC128118103 isoform X2 [Peromyscus californicus insignis]